MADTLERLVAESEQYEQATRIALAALETGFDLGSGPLPSRDEPHERRRSRS
jgi:hypothetical protein